MQFQVQFINFDDDWVGASFRYRDDNNYYRLEMSRVFGIVRLKRCKSGAKVTIWDEKYEYTTSQFYTLRIQDFTDRITVFLDEGLDGYASEETWTPLCGRISMIGASETQPAGSRICTYHYSEE